MTPSRKRAHERAPELLSGGNPRIPRGDGEAPVAAWLAALPGWKGERAARLDALVVATVPGVRKAVRWNTPFYGLEGRGWFLGVHALTRYLKVTFLNGAALDPEPPVAGKSGPARSFHLHEADPFDADLLAAWIRQAAEAPGEPLF